MNYFTSLTREIGIGANSYLLELGGDKVILDAGMHPKKEGNNALPAFNLLLGETVKAIFISHCHLDHIGSLPVIMRESPKAEVFMTEATAKIGDAMLHNSINVMSRQRDELGLSEYPFYTHRETERLVERWRQVPVGRSFNLKGERPEKTEPTFQFFDAGHIPGAVGILFRADGKTIFYTGDVLFDDQNLTPGARFPEGPLDTLIIETTRGDSPSDPDMTRAAEISRLGAAICDVHASGGSVLIPVFALGKTQELLAIIYLLKEKKIISNSPVYIGGLSTKITGIVDSLRHRIPRLQPDFCIMDKLEPFSLDGNEVSSMALRSGRIYAMSSGMMTKNTLSHTLARRLLPEMKHAVFFVGYTDPDSPGGKIKAAWKAGKSEADLGDGLDPLPIRCRIEDFAFSGHASREGILRFILSVQPQKILLVHGDPAAMNWFEERLNIELPGAKVFIPQAGERIEL